MKNQFHDRVVALRDAGRIPRVLTVNTWAGWSVDSTSSIDPSNLQARADILGMDIDGTPGPTALPVRRTTDEREVHRGLQGRRLHRLARARVHHACVAGDPTNVKRIAWLQSKAAKISRAWSAGIPAPQMVAWVDTAGIR